MAMEVKVYYRKKTPHKIDHIPNCFQLPRTASVSKPRTEFNLPIRSFKVELDSHNSTEIKSSVTVGCSDMSNDTIKGMIDLPSTRSSEPKRSGQKTLTNGKKVLVTNLNFFGENALVRPCSNRNHEDGDVNPTPLEVTPNKPQVTEEFHYKKQPRSYKESSSSPDGPDRERDNSSSSGRVEAGSTGRARSQRERKRKVHFDEVSCPLYASKKVRRFKIMRFLGLAAPVGSPFISS